MSAPIDLSVAAVARLLGVSPDSECDAEGVTWRRGRAAGAPVFLLPGYTTGYSAADGQVRRRFPEAETAQAAAQAFVDGGDWCAGARTTWVSVSAWQAIASVDDSGKRVMGRYAETRHLIAVAPYVPACAEGHEHDWRSDHEVVGGLKENPGVLGHGGGVIVREHCAHCGAYRVTDTWAQCPETGEQGLTATAYEAADDVSLQALVAERS
jgi:hypothetical protein